MMKISNLHFLSKSNIKGNKNSGTITLLICLLTVAITVISCFSVTTVNTVNKYENDYRARALYLSPFLKPLTDDALQGISSLEHVENVVDLVGLKGDNLYYISKTDIDNINEKMLYCDAEVHISGLYEGEKLGVIKGNSLDNSPTFSCLVPSLFYPFSDANDNDFENLEYIDGATLIGKTITVRGYNDTLYLDYFSYENESFSQLYREFPSPEFTFTVVGTYPCSYATTGSFIDLFVSKETDLLMAEMTFEGAGIDLSKTDDSLSLWWNTPEYHEYYVVVDDYDSIPMVFNEVKNELGYDISSLGEKPQDENVAMLATIFKFVGTFLTLSILFISIILLVQSSINSIRERKGFIGLMKAIGYKNHQIFFSLVYEQLYMTMRAFLIGGVISTLVVFFANLKFEHGTYRQMQYIISWNTFGFFLLIAFLIAFLVPLITQLILLKKLTKIQPREAMTAK